MKSSAVQRVKQGGLLMASVVKRQLEMYSGMLETHVLTGLHSSTVALRGGPWPFSHLCTGTALPTLRFFPHSYRSFIQSSVNKGA